jgi:hypothetical protein
VVVIVHDFATSGWEGEGEYPSFSSWLRAAFDDFLEWMT